MPAKIYKKCEFNENYMGIRQTKAVLAVFAVIIILHHISLKTFAQLDSANIANFVFNPFRGVGYLLVAYFFFCSGFGLYKSFSKKEDYLKGFLKKHLTPICVSFLVSDALFQFVRIKREAIAFPANTYSWFIFAIIAMYISFFVCFKFLKKIAVPALLACAILWCAICKVLIFDSYWYNAVFAFPFGVIFAKHFDTITEQIKKRYTAYLIAALAASILLHLLAVNDVRLFGLLGSVMSFSAVKEAQAVLQIISALAFSALIMLLSMKLEIQSKALDFLGGMTLEIYLIHVFFVEIFSKKFINSYQPLYYVENPFLYTLIVIGLTIPAAWAVNLFRTKLFPKIFTAWAESVFKKLVIAAAIIFALTTAYFSISSHSFFAETKEKVEKYKNQFITFTEINGKNMATYVTGSGDHTILLLSDSTDPCPAMLLRPLADKLADNFKVILPDLFGYGFSDKTGSPRSAENIAAELHELVSKLNDGKPVILFSFGTSGICAETYLKNYRNQVEGLVGFDMATWEILKEHFDMPSFTDEQIYYESKRFGKRTRLRGLYLNASGYIQVDVNTIIEAFRAGVMGYYLDELSAMYMSAYANKASADAQAHFLIDGRKLSGFSLPEDLPVLFISSSRSNKNANPKPLDMYKELLTNQSCQKADLMDGEVYYIYYRPDIIEQRIVDFMSGQL